MLFGDLNECKINSAASLKGEKLPDSYLPPRDMRKVLKRLEKQGIYIHIEGKKHIKEEAKSRPGKSKFSNEIRPRLKGRPSMYKISDYVDKFSKVISKPEACKLLNDSLLKSNLFYSVLKFVLKAFWYALRKDKTILQNLFKAFNINISKSNLDAIVYPLIERMTSLDDAALEELIDKSSKSAIEKKLLLDEFFLVGMFNPKRILS
jgi:hypothetical protein